MRESTRRGLSQTKLSTGHGPTRRLPESRHKDRIGYRLKRPSRVAPDRVPASASEKCFGRCHQLVWVLGVIGCGWRRSVRTKSVQGRDGFGGAGERRRRAFEPQLASLPVATRNGLAPPARIGTPGPTQTRAMAQTKPLNSRATATAATCDFLRPGPVRYTKR